MAYNRKLIFKTAALVFPVLMTRSVFAGDPEEHRLIELATRIQADPVVRKMIQRLTVYQRFQHWLLAISFIGYISYLFIFKPERPKYKGFGFMEKFKYWAVFWGCAMIGASEALAGTHENEQLKSWLVYRETTNPQSKLWQRIVNDIRNGIRMHLHGEYNAKIALVDLGDQRPGPTTYQKAAIDRYIKEQDRLSPERKQAVLKEIHQGVSSTGRLCVSCHNSKMPLVGFTAMGYSPKRITSQQNSPVARKIQQIQNGQKFHIYPHPGEITE